MVCWVVSVLRGDERSEDSGSVIAVLLLLGGEDLGMVELSTVAGLACPSFRFSLSASCLSVLSDRSFTLVFVLEVVGGGLRLVLSAEVDDGLLLD